MFEPESTSIFEPKSSYMLEPECTYILEPKSTYMFEPKSTCISTRPSTRTYASYCSCLFAKYILRNAILSITTPLPYLREN